jgi:hypothetical protein
MMLCILCSTGSIVAGVLIFWVRRVVGQAGLSRCVKRGGGWCQQRCHIKVCMDARDID